MKDTKKYPFPVEEKIVEFNYRSGYLWWAKDYHVSVAFRPLPNYEERVTNGHNNWACQIVVEDLNSFEKKKDKFLARIWRNQIYGEVGYYAEVTKFTAPFIEKAILIWEADLRDDETARVQARKDNLLNDMFPDSPEGQGAYR